MQRCVLCRQDKPTGLVQEVNSDRGALVWICRGCWKRHEYMASDSNLSAWFLLRERLSRLVPYETHTTREAGRRVFR